jgi:transcription elongation factor GreB
MSKAFVSENTDDPDDIEEMAQAPSVPLTRNYVTPAGHERLKKELLKLLNVERPEVVSIVSWAASNGDRSENGDYLYGKRRLREIDRRIRFLTRRLETACVVDPEQREPTDQVFFGATVQCIRDGSQSYEVRIVGVDEADAPRGLISWISPLAKALIKAREGDTVMLRTPNGVEQIEIVAVQYKAIELT